MFDWKTAVSVALGKNISQLQEISEEVAVRYLKRGMKLYLNQSTMP